MEQRLRECRAGVAAAGCRHAKVGTAEHEHQGPGDLYRSGGLQTTLPGIELQPLRARGGGNGRGGDAPEIYHLMKRVA